MTVVPETINVWIIEDNQTFCRNAVAAINANSDLRCTASFRSCEDALTAIKAADLPHVVLMDIGLPGMSGIEGIGRMRELAPLSEVVVLTVFEDEDKLFNAICAGASGYLLKGAGLDGIADAVRLAHAGGSPMTPLIARRVLGFFKKLPIREHNYGLTDRERDILQLLVEGLVKKEIAVRLGISFHTVDKHLRHIYVKLHVNTATGAVAKAIREKLV